MDVPFSPDMQSKLVRLAREQGTDSETVIKEAVSRMVEHDEWFRAEVRKGLEQIKSGQTVSHEEAGDRLRAHLTRKQRPA